MTGDDRVLLPLDTTALQPNGRQSSPAPRPRTPAIREGRGRQYDDQGAQPADVVGMLNSGGSEEG
jgi:hypothetical protein